MKPKGKRKIFNKSKYNKKTKSINNKQKTSFKHKNTKQNSSSYLNKSNRNVNNVQQTSIS